MMNIKASLLWTSTLLLACQTLNAAPPAFDVVVTNDDSNPVGRVHFGLVYRLALSAAGGASGPEKVRIREIHKLAGGFVRLVEIQRLWEDPHGFEGWSRIVLETLFNLPRQGEDPTSTESD